MVPPYYNPLPLPPSPFNLELSGDDHHGDHHEQQQYQHRHLFNLEEVPQSSSFNSSSTSSLSSPVFFTPTQVVEEGPRPDHFREPQDFHFQLLQADHNIVSYGGSCDSDHQTVDNEPQKGTILKFSISKSGDAKNGNINPSTHEEINTSSVKWMSSKMRMMRKMTNPDQTSSSSTNSSDEKPIPMNKLSEEINTNNVPIIRVCSDCSTTKTPLWRSGPRGPKSLCNACGIRQRKARRAMAAAAAAASGATVAVPLQKKENKSSSSSPKSTLPFKKRCNKLITPSPARGRPKKICFEDFKITMKNHKKSSSASAAAATATATAAAAAGTLQAVFPQDEKEAAILLMALSCGLVHG